MSVDITWLEDKFFKRNLSESEKSVLSNLKEFKHRQSERIIEQGKPGGRLFILYAGKVGVEVISNGTRSHIVDIKEGNMIGEFSFLSGKETRADVIAMENCVVYMLTKEQFEIIMSSECQLAYDIFQRMLESSSHALINLEYKLLPFLKVVSEKVRNIPLIVKILPVIFVILYMLAFFYISWKDFSY